MAMTMMKTQDKGLYDGDADTAAAVVDDDGDFDPDAVGDDDGDDGDDKR